ncbi:MAG: SURF1 family protein [Parvibaculales bacterium]
MVSARAFLPLVLTAIMLAACLSLGTWQVQRLQWKQGLLAQIEARRNAEPINLHSGDDMRRLTEASDNYRPALLHGRLGAPQGFWFTQIHNAPDGLPRQAYTGYHVLSPFILADGSAILLDRGFVPAALKETMAATPPAADSALQALPVILRWPDRRGRFDAEDKPQEGLFYVRDPQRLGVHWQLAMPPFIAEAAETGTAWPRGGQTRMSLSNRHLEYAVTWYGLAVVLVIVSGLWHMQRRNRKANGDAL